MKRGRVVWLTGLPGAGKSTMARALEHRLRADGHHVWVIDGDELRKGLSADLGFGEHDRAENVRRAGEVARLFCEAGLIAIVALISPRRADRDRVRARFAPGEFLEVFINCPLAECERRDPKGLYRAARAGRLEGLTGVGAPYERPLAPEVELLTSELAVGDCVPRVLDRLGDGLAAPE